MNFTATPRRRALIVVSAAAAVTVASLAVAVQATAVTPSVTVSISPTTAQARVAANYVETFKMNTAVSDGAISTVVPAGWTSPQTSQPGAAGYVAGSGTCSAVTPTPTLSPLTGGGTQLTLHGITCTRGSSLMLSYLDASAQLKGRYTFGPSSVQPSPGSAFAAVGSPAVNVAAGPTTQFAVKTSSLTRTAGVGFGINVTPEDAAGEVSSYSGTVALSSTDQGSATALPTPTLITAGHSFTVILTSAGTQSITATDTSHPSLTGTLAGITVRPAATSLLSWSAVTAMDPNIPAGQYPVGAQVSYTISAMDKYHNVTPAFSSKVATTSTTDTGAALPAVYKFVPGTDQGQHTFVLTPSKVGSQTYTATDTGNANIKGSATLPVGLAISPHAALTGTVGVPFSQTYQASGATGGVTWSAAGLPSWLSLDPSSGAVSGTPTSAGVFGPFTITATDSANPVHTGSWTYSMTVAQGTQTVTITSAAPQAPYYQGPTYTPQGTSTSGLGDVFSIDPATSAVCAIDDTGVVSFIGTGTCTVDGDQPGDANYLPAPQVQQSFTVTGAAQTIALTTTAPTDAVVDGATYTPAAIASSGLTVTFSIDNPGTAPCTITDGVVTFTAIGTCVIDADQAGDTEWLAAPQVQQSIAVAGLPQSIQFTSTAPSSAEVGDTYTPAATATSDLPVALTIDDPTNAPCTMAADGTVTFTNAGTCVIDADQPGDTRYAAASQVQQSFAVTEPVPTISFVTAAPDDAVVGGATYTPQATVTPAGSVTLTVDDASAGVCSIDASDVVSFAAVGSCTIDANEPGSSAAQQQQSITVGQGTRTIAFTSAVPVGEVVAGLSYYPTAMATPSGVAATVTVDPSTATICAISPTTGAVNMIWTGTCTLDANLDGDANWNAATQVQMSFSIARLTPSITINPDDDIQQVTVPPNPLVQQCPAQTIISGGCFVNPLDGEFTNVFVADVHTPHETDPESDPGYDDSLVHVGYHWTTYKPPGLGSTIYSSNGITGYHSSVLTIAPSSLPELIGTDAGTDIFWRYSLTVTVTNGITGGVLSYTMFFKGAYQSSTLTLALSTKCQLEGHNPDTICQVSAYDGLVATEPT